MNRHFSFGYLSKQSFTLAVNLVFSLTYNDCLTMNMRNHEDLHLFSTTLKQEIRMLSTQVFVFLPRPTIS